MGEEIKIIPIKQTYLKIKGGVTTSIVYITHAGAEYEIPVLATYKKNEDSRYKPGSRPPNIPDIKELIE